MYARKQYLIHHRFQLDFLRKMLLATLLPCLLCTIFFIGYLLIVQYSGATEQGRNYFSTIAPSLLLRLLLIVFAIIVFSVFFSHRIAGPVKKMSQALVMMANDQPTVPLRLRKTDYFKDLAIKINRINNLSNKG